MNVSAEIKISVSTTARFRPKPKRYDSRFRKCMVFYLRNTTLCVRSVLWVMARSPKNRLSSPKARSFHIIYPNISFSKFTAQSSINLHNIHELYYITYFTIQNCNPRKIMMYKIPMKGVQLSLK